MKKTILISIFVIILFIIFIISINIFNNINSSHNISEEQLPKDEEIILDNAETRLYVTVDDKSTVADIPQGDWYIPVQRDGQLGHNRNTIKGNFEKCWNELSGEPIIIDYKNDISFTFQLSRYGHARNDLEFTLNNDLLIFYPSGSFCVILDGSLQFSKKEKDCITLKKSVWGQRSIHMVKINDTWYAYKLVCT